MCSANTHLPVYIYSCTSIDLLSQGIHRCIYILTCMYTPWKAQPVVSHHGAPGISEWEPPRLGYSPAALSRLELHQYSTFKAWLQETSSCISKDQKSVVLLYWSLSMRPRQHGRFVLIGLCWLYGRSAFSPPPLCTAHRAALGWYDHRAARSIARRM